MLTVTLCIGLGLIIGTLVWLYVYLLANDDSFYGKNSQMSDPSSFNEEDKGLTDQQIYQREIRKWTDRHQND